jgi:23S rRNA-/tRNA-specific pseudouridylate synthase
VIPDTHVRRARAGLTQRAPPAAAEAAEGHRVRALAAELRGRVLFRDEALLVLDKPPGLAAQVTSTFMGDFFYERENLGLP